MDHVTHEQVDEAIDILGRFVRYSLDSSIKGAPDVDDVRAAIAVLIAANIFNTDNYEIQNLLRVSESKKGVSHNELRAHLTHLMPNEMQSWALGKQRAIYGWHENENPFVDD